jgi:hypothetical protein
MRSTNETHPHTLFICDIEISTELALAIVVAVKGVHLPDIQTNVYLLGDDSFWTSWRRLTLFVKTSYASPGLIL